MGPSNNYNDTNSCINLLYALKVNGDKANRKIRDLFDKRAMTYLLSGIYRRADYEGEDKQIDTNKTALYWA